MSAIVGIDTWAEWGCRPVTLERNPRPVGVAVHYPGPGWYAFDSHAKCREVVRAWDAQHRARGSRMLEYGAIICQHRIVLEGRNRASDPMTRVGSNGTYASNSSHLSVQLMRGTNDKPPTDMELRALGEWIALLRKAGAGGQVRGHRDFYATSCPGDPLYRALPTIDRYADEAGNEPMAEYADYHSVYNVSVPRGREVTLATVDTTKHDGQALLFNAQFAFKTGTIAPSRARLRFVRVPKGDGTGEADLEPTRNVWRGVHNHVFVGGDKVEVRVTFSGRGNVTLNYLHFKAARFG